MLAFLDRPGDPCGGEPPAGLLRPGNAGANTVADQIAVAEEALEQLHAGGHRFQAILTDRAGEAARLERDHRARARCEDRIRCAKQTGLELLPFTDFAMNAVWLELVLIAQLLLALTDTPAAARQASGP